ncbi:rod shape-determining protein MreD [Alicyclobacillus tolerans]|uniref:rod shape-determining protein MreD n=1 Tax=Alicyclobacillus TaxID=29330 RepID=UPI001932DD78|nr:rod shape-determining protein MreD [Alicyclobacillus sp. TC]QRF23213.1 rod shape-determining protein MreD [Alicyclobacillus sp. TC]
MKIFVTFIALWIGLILQSTVFQIPPYNAIQPDFVLVGLVLVALMRGTKPALFLGLLLGLIQDVVFGSFIGLNAFALAVIAYFAAAAFAQFMHKNITITFLVTLCCSFIDVWLTFGFTRMFGVTAYSWITVIYQSLEQMLINGILVLLLYPLAIKFLAISADNHYGKVPDGE